MGTVQKSTTFILLAYTSKPSVELVVVGWTILTAFILWKKWLSYIKLPILLSVIYWPWLTRETEDSIVR